MHSPRLQSAKIHLGCGQKRLPGFINIDSRPSEGTDIICDMTSLPFEENTLEIVYMCHSLEHIPLYEVQPFLSKIYSLLCPSGKIYISVPDFQALASLYLANITPLSMIVRAIHGGQEYSGNTHFMSYDYKMLSSFLYDVGFKDVLHYKPDTFLPPGFTDTSTYRIAGKLISLNLVASK